MTCTELLCFCQTNSVGIYLKLCLHLTPDEVVFFRGAFSVRERAQTEEIKLR